MIALKQYLDSVAILCWCYFNLLSFALDHILISLVYIYILPLYCSWGMHDYFVNLRLQPKKIVYNKYFVKDL